MFSGDEIERDATHITIGRRSPPAMNSISCIRASPCDAVAVIVRQPDAAEPMHAAIAECSLSTATNSESTLPSFT